MEGGGGVVWIFLSRSRWMGPEACRLGESRRVYFVDLRKTGEVVLNRSGQVQASKFCQDQILLSP